MAEFEVGQVISEAKIIVSEIDGNWVVLKAVFPSGHEEELDGGAYNVGYLEQLIEEINNVSSK